MTNREAIKRGLPIFVAAINMRAGLTLMNPLLPILKHQYHLSSFQLSFLTSLAVFCFAGTAFLMPLVSKIRGTERIITVALIVLTSGIIFRAVGNVQILFISSLAVGVSIAVLNFTLPVWVKENTPGHSGLMTGIYITIMGVFAATSVAVAVPLAKSTGFGWRVAMAPWAILGLISTVWWVLRIRRSRQVVDADLTIKFQRTLLRRPSAWGIALFFGLQSMLFYGTATWLPTILVSKGFSLSNAGFAVSITGFLGSLIGIAAPHYASKLHDLRLILGTVSAFVAFSFAAMTFTHGSMLVLWLMVSNIGLSISFPLSLLLTVLRSTDASETRSLSIMSQSIGYLMATFAPGIVGAVYDSTLNWNTALAVPAGLAVVMGVVGLVAGAPLKIKA